MLPDIQLITLGQNMAKLVNFRVFGVLGFCFGWVQVTFRLPPLKAPARVHAFLYLTCHCRLKIGHIGHILGYTSFRVWFCLIQMTYLRPPLKSLALVNAL